MCKETGARSIASLQDSSCMRPNRCPLSIPNEDVKLSVLGDTHGTTARRQRPGRPIRNPALACSGQFYDVIKVFEINGYPSDTNWVGIRDVFGCVVVFGC